jgi:hypothetical protein
MTGPLKGAMPAAARCRISGCTNLKSHFIDTLGGIRRRTYCEITGKIPGNMKKCPLEDQEESD